MKGRSTVSLAVIVVVLELTLTFVQGFSGFASSWFEKPYQGVGFFLGLQIVVLFGYLAIRHAIDTDQFPSLLKSVDALASKVGDTRFITAEQFYTEFELAVKNATKSVAICHLDTKPPTRLRGSRSDHYYEQITKLMKRKTTVRFQRLERLSKEKEDWIKELAQKMSGQKNASLRFLAPDPGHRKLGLVSVQLVDSNLTFLVAVARHDPQRGPRDIVIKSAEGNQMWREYFDSLLWANAEVLVENGELSEDAIAKLGSMVSR